MSRLADALTRRAVDAYKPDSLSGRARLRRWEEFADAFPAIGEMRVVDLGGDARAWRNAPVRPAHVTLVNIFEQKVAEPWMDAVVGDACDPDFALPAADLVYSNSVIEHVGGHWRRERFAEAARSKGSYWVQTPNRYFPIEPHFMVPWLQHLPRGAQAKLVVAWPMGNHGEVSDPDQALRDALEIELLSRSEMKFYFPDAEIRHERVACLTKSFIAVKQA